MNEQRRPIFGFLWPKPDPSAPVDGDYEQVRPLRIPRRGPFRWAMLLIGTVSLAAATGSAILAAMAAPMTATAFAGAGLSATAFVLILRGWVVGTFVNDAGVTVETTWRRRYVPWTEVASSPSETARVPLLGLPIPVTGERVVVYTRDGRRIVTHLYSTSPDLLLRSEAFRIARDQWATWASAD